MAKRYTNRLLQVFSLHIRQGQGVPDYSSVMRKIAQTAPPNRFLELGDKLVGIPRFEIKGKRAFLVAYTGEKGLLPLIFNSAQASERIGNLRQDEVLATRTHGLVNWQRRECIIEFNLHGAKANDIAIVLEHVA